MAAVQLSDEQLLSNAQRTHGTAIQAEVHEDVVQPAPAGVKPIQAGEEEPVQVRQEPVVVKGAPAPAEVVVATNKPKSPNRRLSSAGSVKVIASKTVNALKAVNVVKSDSKAAAVGQAADGAGGDGKTGNAKDGDAKGAEGVAQGASNGAESTAGASSKTATKSKRRSTVVEPEPEPDPLADKPLWISTSALVVRKEAAVDSAKLDDRPGGMLPGGALMRVVEEVEFITGITNLVTKRMKVVLDGDKEPLGWLTGLTTDNVENLRKSNASFPLMRASKALVCRDGLDPAKAKKLDDIAKGTKLRVIEQQAASDGSVKALVGRDGAMLDEIGWITRSKPEKDEVTLEPVPTLSATFDLKAHTSKALATALKRKQDRMKTSVSASRKKRGEGGLPYMPVGRKPAQKGPDDGLLSRHAVVTQPASMVLMFNCTGAAFEVTEWSGAMPFELPGEQAFDLVSKSRRRRLGRVALARELHEPFLDRVQFPDEWVLGDDCGLEHDGWQGEGVLDLELTCGRDVATIRICPWLAYGCSIGARINIRQASSSQGQCATVSRILFDDRIVARVDGYAKEVGVKAEVIVDLQPSTVVPTAGPGYDRGQKIFLLIRNRILDAVVMHWSGATNFQEGSRHMVNVKPPGALTGAPSWPSLNVFNHVAAPPGVTAAIFEELRNKYCEFLISTQDTVEDAITGNSLPIKEQLIFMQAVDVKDGCKPPEYMTVDGVPQLVTLMAKPSPHRVHGGHVAQPVLCRAGPGTGKTWMIKQTLFLLASALLGDAAGDGARLMPFVVYVQRIVRLLSEHGEDPSVLLADPEGLMRWYIRNEFADSKDRCQLLLLAFEMRALVILVDGVDEAAGMRDIVEAFVHYELVVSGNRLVVTSRPEGVDLEDYRRSFVVMNLLELSQEQQRNVIQMQLQGNLFFEHLVNLGECRRDMDTRYRKAFSTEAQRNEMESLTFIPVDEDAKRDEKEREKDKDREEDEDDDALAVDESASKPEQLVVVTREPLVRRRVSLDNHQDLQAWMSRAIPELQLPLESGFLHTLNKAMMKHVAAYENGSLLEQLDIEIRAHPSPCTRAQVAGAVGILLLAQKGELHSALGESLVQLGLLRKLPLTGGRRGAKAAPMPAMGLWCQVVRLVDQKYAQIEVLAPKLFTMIGRLAAVMGITSLAPKRHPDFAGLPPGQREEEWLPNSAEQTPELTPRNPVALWLDCTYPGVTEPSEGQPPAWCATVLIKCHTGDQCIHLLKLLNQGVEMQVNREPARLTMLGLQNTFDPETLHPTHQRSVSCHMLLTTFAGSIAVRVQVEHRDVLEQYRTSNYKLHYSYFWDRTPLTQPIFDQKFESLLVFLVEAIGIPVLLSLLLLTYSATGDGDMLDLDELPQDRLQLYKLGIKSGIRKRLAYEMREGANAAEVTEEEQTVKRIKRKSALEQGDGTSKSTGEQSTIQVRGPGVDPVLDLNSLLRGKKVRVVQGDNEVAEAYALVVRVLDRAKGGVDTRTAITAVVPKSHSLHAVVTAFVEYVLMPVSQNEALLQQTGKKMLRNVAVDNQQNGRREFTSKHVACALGATPEELGLWTRLDQDHDHGVALTATLSKQTEKAPAQYQFKHLSFQEGLYAEYLLLLITSLQAPGPGWEGWATNDASADFLNNRYMNNTCRIAAGHLGSLLAKQRARWDFREAQLTPNGRQALWFITEENDTVASINVAHNDISAEDVHGLCKTIVTCPTLQVLDLSENDLNRLSIDAPAQWSRVCEALSNNGTITDLNLNSNHLGAGIRTLSRALISCTSLKRLGLSFNEPGIEPAMCDLFKLHPSLVSVELVEATDRHFPNRAKDEIGRALIENKARTLGFLHCDNFVLSEKTTSLAWPKEASTSDAVLLAGVLVTNTVLTTFNIAAGATLANTARSALGEALLNNPGSRLAFCNDFGLQPNVDTCEFDLSKPELKEVEPFRLLAGCLRGNRTLTHVTLKQLRSEQIPTLALALRGNSTLNKLDLIHISRVGGQSIIRLPVPELNGATGDGEHRVDMSPACLEGALGRVACEIIGTLIAPNTQLQCLDLSNTGLGLAIGSEGEGGHILLRPLCESKTCPLSELNLSNIQLSDKAGAKLLSSLSNGLSKKASGYDKITSLSLASNELGDSTGHTLKEVLWGERAPCVLRYLDLSSNVDLSGHDIALAIRRNESLTSLDIRNIPAANTDTVFNSIGSFLLQEECQCRLGFLSCNAFQVVAEQAELCLQPAAPAAAPAPAEKNSAPRRVRDDAVLMLFAGVLKFNSSLTKLEVLDMGLDDAAAKNFNVALCENTVLEYLDISGNPVGAEGVAVVADAVRTHPSLASFKVDGAALPVPQIRGAKGADPRLDVSDWGLGPLSGHAIGTLAKQASSLTEMILKNNALGPDGAAALVNGLGESAVRSLDLTRNNLAGEAATIGGLSVAINRHLGSLLELRMDENDLDCEADELSPLCKLRSLRTLSMDKNRLAALPALLGTILTLRKISLHTNQIVTLPPSLCLLVSLETLDLHKNLIRVLPTGVGNLRALQRLDLSENKLSELPSTICELSDALVLSVGRNPLEKPSIEQARQGIGAIRRYFGFNRSKAVEDPNDAEAKAAIALKSADEGNKEAQPLNRPEHVEGTPSRHDWAGPAGVVALFNCNGCKFVVMEGSGDVDSISPDESIELIAAFNLQVVGKVRKNYNNNRVEPFQERAEFGNVWLPWCSQDADLMEPPTLVVTLKWQAPGLSKQSASLLVVPWLAFGCSVGARMKLATGYATVLNIREDDTCELVMDNSSSVHNALLGPDVIDPRPDTISRTTSPSYKSGQKLLLMHEGTPQDAVVEEWLGLRRGSRHRVRLGGKADRRSTKDKVSIEVDLNEANHTKLLFATVTKYESTRQHFCDILAGRNRTLRDETLLPANDIHVGEQCLRLQGWQPSVDEPGLAEDGEDGAEAETADEAPDQAAGRGSTAGAPAALEGKGRTHDSQGRKGGSRAASPTPGEALHAAPPPAADEPGAAGLSEPSGPPISAVRLVEQLIDPTSSSEAASARMFFRADSKVEHDLLHSHILYLLATKLRDAVAQRGAIRLVPLPITSQRLLELLADEALAKRPPRDLIVKAFELDYPGYVEMIKQAMEMRALVAVVKVAEHADFATLPEAILEELGTNRMALTCCATSDNPARFPAALVNRCLCKQLCSIELVFRSTKVIERDSKLIFRKVRQHSEGVWHLVRGVHLSFGEMGRDGLAELQECLISRACTLQSLNLRLMQVDAWAVLQVLRANTSLTALDMRQVPRMRDLYQPFAELLQASDTQCRLAYLRCDAFEIVEESSALNLSEVVLNKKEQPGAVALLAQLLTWNTSLLEVDLTASDLDKDGAAALAAALQKNTTLKSLRLAHNPALDDDVKAALGAISEKRGVALEL